MSELWTTLSAVRAAVADEIEVLARRQADVIYERVDEQGDLADQAVLDAAADRCRGNCLDAMLSREFADKTAAAVGIDQPDLQLLAFDLRQSAAALRIELPEPVIQARVTFLVIIAGLGALAGMALGAWICVLLRISPESYEAARALGGLIGPAVAVALGGYVTHRERLRRAIQWILGAAAVGIGVTEVLSWLNPAAQLWRVFSGRIGTAGRWGKLKLLLWCLVLIALLQLAKPVKKTDRERLRRTIHSAVKSWLDSQVDLMALLLVLQRDRAVSAPATPPSSGIATAPVLEALRKLSSAGSVEDRSDVAKEVIQECENAGIVFASAGGDGVFDESLLEIYDVVGLIRPGDPYRVLEPAIREGERVVVKGRITPKRST